MSNSELKDFLKDLLNNLEIKSIEIIDWKEMGEYSGEKPLPIIKITKKTIHDED